MVAIYPSGGILSLSPIFFKSSKTYIILYILKISFDYEMILSKFKSLVNINAESCY